MCLQLDRVTLLLKENRIKSHNKQFRQHVCCSLSHPFVCAARALYHFMYAVHCTKYNGYSHMASQPTDLIYCVG